MKTIISCVAVGAFLFLSGCATPPKTHQFDKARTFNKSFEKAWQNTIQFFTSNSIPIKTIEKSSGVIYAEKLNGSAEEADTFADCGVPGIALVISTKISLNVFLQKVGPNQSKATINTLFTQVREFDRRRHEVSCNSRGTLEQRLLTALSS